MTVIADNKKRVTLPDAKPGDRFDLQFTAEGSVVLRKLEPVKRSVTYVKKDGLLLARTNQPITMTETRAGIDKFAL